MEQTCIVSQLKSGKSVTYFTIGVSMRPLLIERQTHVRIEPLQRARRNDILLYIRENGSLVLHRMMKQDAHHFYMRGDNTFCLEKIGKEQAVGVVTQIYRKGKYIEVDKCRMYRIYVWFWRGIYPLRCIGRKIKHGIKR